MDAISVFAELLRGANQALRFNMVEVGARPIHQGEEPFYSLLSLFPGSRIDALEPDEKLCARQNEVARPGLTFHPLALGRTEERRTFYETRDPMCSSLYQPNEAVLDRYNNLDVARTKRTTTIETMSLDRFVGGLDVESIDFIKIDIQGGELDVFQGGCSTLENVLAIVTEAAFIEHYVDQPLFGDVCAFLTSQGMQFQKILGAGGRTLKPVVLNNDPNFCGQQLWADVLFFQDMFCGRELSSHQHLKLAVLALMYGCLDLALVCCGRVDEREGQSIGPRLVERLNAASGR